ncbi:MAG TPA: pyridoxal-phosphate dependent enzyme, partial [Candidatus Eisenbacteria bacterium]
MKGQTESMSHGAGASTPAKPQIYGSILETVGDTPLVKLRSVAKDARATVLAKLEGFNPGGSVKDRIAVAI